jgi:hypothetical protein
MTAPAAVGATVTLTPVEQRLARAVARERLDANGVATTQHMGADPLALETTGVGAEGAARMTVAQFYAQHQVDGRAVVTGSMAEPSKWVARGPWTPPSSSDYVVCFEGIDGVRWVRGEQPLAQVIAPPRRSRVQGVTTWTV